MRHNILSVFLAVFLFAGCADKNLATSPPDVRGLPGQRSQEVELLFAKAHALWKGESCAEPQEAVRMLSEAIGKDPDFAAALAYRGLAYSELGKREDAFHDLTKAIQLEPRAEYYVNRGLVSLRAGLPAAARRDLEYALTNDRKQHRAWNILGDTALREGDAGQACGYYVRGCSNGDCEPLQRARKDGLCK